MDISPSFTPISDRWTLSPASCNSSGSDTLTTGEEVESTVSDSTSASIREQSKDRLVPSFIATDENPLPFTRHIQIISKGVVPVRLAKAFKEIDAEQETSIAVAKKSAERAHALNFRRGGNRAISVEIEDKKNQAIQIANQKANDAKAKLLKGATSISDGSKISEGKEISTYDSSSNLCQQYAEEFARIKQGELAAIEAVEHQAAHSNALMVGSSRGIGINLLIEEKKGIAIDEVRRVATRKKNMLLLNAKKDLLEYHEQEFTNLCHNYLERLDGHEGSISFEHRAVDGDRFDLGATKQIIENTFQLERELLAVVEDPEKENDNLLLEDVAFFDRANTTRLKALQPLAELSIDQALAEIEKSTDFLKRLIEGSRGNPFVDQANVKEMSLEIREARAGYFAAEAVAGERRSQVALQNAHHLQKRTETITAGLTRLSSAGAIVKEADKKAFSEAIALLEGHLEHLEKIQQSYQQIATDCSCSEAALSTVRKQESFVPQESKTIAMRNEIFQKLSKLSSSQPSSQQENKLNILLKLENIPKEQEENFILGSRGEIKFVAPSMLTTVTSRSKQDGLNLVRLAIFRDYGAAGLRRFDRHFNPALVSEHPINVKQLMDFVDEENTVNPKAFYLSSIHSLRELIVAESHSDGDHKLVQAGSSTFKLTSTKDDGGVDLAPAQQKQAALKATRQAVDKFFKELPLEKRQHILQRFNNEFKGSGEETKPLTVQNLRSFLKKELENERSLFAGNHIAESLFYSAALQSVVTLWGTAAPAVSTILGGWPAFLINFGLAMVHDLTTTWRELHPEE